MSPGHLTLLSPMMGHRADRATFSVPPGARRQADVHQGHLTASISVLVTSHMISVPVKQHSFGGHWPPHTVLKLGRAPHGRPGRWVRPSCPSVDEKPRLQEAQPLARGGPATDCGMQMRLSLETTAVSPVGDPSVPPNPLPSCRSGSPLARPPRYRFLTVLDSLGDPLCLCGHVAASHPGLQSWRVPTAP